MGTFLSLHRKSLLLVSRWCLAWVFMWCSTFFSCSVFCERRLALLQTSQSRDVYLRNSPPPHFAVNALEGFVLHPLVSILTTVKIVTMWTQKLLECAHTQKKKKAKKKHSSGCLRAKKHLECWTKTPNNPQTALLTNSWNYLSFLRLDGWF